MSTFNQNNDTQLTNLIVNYLPQNMTDKELFSMFVTIGPVESCRVMKDNKTGYSFGFGFVNYSRKEDAARAISSLNGLQVQNKRLKVSYARPSGEEIKETNLYVTNLPRTITEEQLEFMFSKFGRIVQKNLLKDKVTGMPRGVAFVRYDRREEALEAIERMNGTVPDGSQDPITVKIAEEHGKQKAAYYAGFHAGYNQSRGGGAAGKKPGSVVTPNRGGFHNPRGNQAANYNNPLYSAYQPVIPSHRNLPGNFGGAVRQDKSHYRFNPVAFNTGYNVGGGYY